MGSHKSPVIAIIGRLGGPKGVIVRRVLKEVMPEILAEFPLAQILVCGEPVLAEDHALSAEFPNIKFLGRLPYDKLPYQKSDIVIGAGRVALEALRLGKAVLGLGERLYIGPIGPANCGEAMSSNFGDCAGNDHHNLEQLKLDLLSLLRNSRARKKMAAFGPKFVANNYQLATVENGLRKIYAEAILEKNLARVSEIPVLMYHRVTPTALENSLYNIYITTEKLEEQLQQLKSLGCETITFADLFARRLPRRPVILTFDDGYRDNYENLLPLLKKYGMKAVIYCLADSSLKSNLWDQAAGEPPAALMTAQQIKKIAQTGHVEIGSHGLCHRHLRTLSDSALRRELAESRRILENICGKTVLSFCYPYGEHDARIRHATAQAGYRFGVAVDSGPYRFARDLFCIRRIQIFPHTRASEFRRKISGYYLRYRYLKSVARLNPNRTYTNY